MILQNAKKTINFDWEIVYHIVYLNVYLYIGALNVQHFFEFPNA